MYVQLPSPDHVGQPRSTWALSGYMSPQFFVSLLSLPCREVDKAKRAVLELQLRDWQCRSGDRLPGRPTCAILQSWPLRSCIFCGFVQAAGAINVVSSSSVLPECCTASSRVCRTEGGASGAGIEARVRNNCQQPEQRQGTSPEKDAAPARKTERTSWEPEEKLCKKRKIPVRRKKGRRTEKMQRVRKIAGFRNKDTSQAKQRKHEMETRSPVRKPP